MRRLSVTHSGRFLLNLGLLGAWMGFGLMIVGLFFISPYLVLALGVGLLIYAAWEGAR